MSLSNWKPYSQKIDNSSSLGEGRFASGAFLMIAAGPPRLAALGGAAVAGAALSSPAPFDFGSVVRKVTI